jgi:two-component system response regulator MprA
VEATRVLVVDDDPHIVLGLQTALEAEGYRVTTAADGVAALAAIAESDPAVVVLDVAMPRMDGLAVARTLRSMGDRLPILMLTARDQPKERVAGLDAGADDYLGKPFDLDEFLARVRALVRRVADDSRSGRRFGALVLEVHDRVLVAPTARVPLTRIETALLEAFFAEPLRTRSRTELMQVVWGEDPPRSNALEVYLSQLRRKLAESGLPDLVVTVRGVGYRLVS